MNTFFWKNKRVLVTGGHGFLGSHLVEKLTELGAIVHAPTSKEADLRIKENCKKVVKNQDMVFHLAAKVGGIGFNMSHPAEMYYENILMGTYLIEESYRAGVKKFVALGTICAYPKFTPIPFSEENLWNGYPEETNAPYGLAKKMLLVQSLAYRKQYNFNSIYLLPVNLYGPRDNFDPSKSHVIPALIKKFFEAKKSGEAEVVVWGTGKPTREFLYVQDAVKGILLAGEKYNKEFPVNIGAGFEISIRELAQAIKRIVGYKGRIIFDSTKPDGQPRRSLSTHRAYKEFQFKASTSFSDGLKKTIDWYGSHEKRT